MLGDWQNNLLAIRFKDLGECSSGIFPAQKASPVKLVVGWLGGREEARKSVTYS